MSSLALALLLAPLPALAAEDGRATYEATCATCHQDDGSGVPGVYPPLADRIGRFVRIPEGRRYLARVVRHGMFGPIRIEDRPYNGYMPPQPQLDHEALAALLNYVLSELSPAQLPEDFAPLTAGEVEGYLVPQATPSEIRKEREALLETLEERAAAGDVRLAKGPVAKFGGPSEDFARNCQGCHRADGMGAPGAVPRLKGFVGRFTHHPEGRAFLVRVPGVAYAMLDDARLAAMLNWMLETYSPAEVAPSFEPYTADEVAALRQKPITDPTRTRERLVRGLRERGIIGADDGLSPSPE